MFWLLVASGSSPKVLDAAASAPMDAGGCGVAAPKLWFSARLCNSRILRSFLLGAVNGVYGAGVIAYAVRHVVDGVLVEPSGRVVEAVLLLGGGVSGAVYHTAGLMRRRVPAGIAAWLYVSRLVEADGVGLANALASLASKARGPVGLVVPASGEVYAAVGSEGLLCVEWLEKGYVFAETRAGRCRGRSVEGELFHVVLRRPVPRVRRITGV